VAGGEVPCEAVWPRHGEEHMSDEANPIRILAVDDQYDADGGQVLVAPVP